MVVVEKENDVAVNDADSEVTVTVPSKVVVLVLFGEVDFEVVVSVYVEVIDDCVDDVPSNRYGVVNVEVCVPVEVNVWTDAGGTNTTTNGNVAVVPSVEMDISVTVLVAL